MKRIIFAQCIACAAIISNAAYGFGPQYVGIDLYSLQLPPGAYFGFGQPIGNVPMGDGQVAGFASGNGYPEGTHAMVFKAPAGAAVDLHPTNISGFAFSEALATDGVHQVGDGTPSDSFGINALLWSGSSNTAVNLQPTNFNYLPYTWALGVAGNQQVGYGFTGFQVGNPTNHPLLWNGTSGSAVDLMPTQFGAIEARAVATDGSYQAGFAMLPRRNGFSAMLWHGTAASAVNLHPADLGPNSSTMVLDVQGGQQVGDLVIQTAGHAVLWNGTAQSMVDLHPINLPGFDDDGTGFNPSSSSALGTNGTQQVGVGNSSDPVVPTTHALMWSGTAASAVDLHLLLPPGFIESNATTIDADGTIWGTAYSGVDNNYHAVKWTLVPEPQSALLLTVATLLSIPFRRRAAKNRC